MILILIRAKPVSHPPGRSILISRPKPAFLSNPFLTLPRKFRATSSKEPLCVSRYGPRGFRRKGSTPVPQVAPGQALTRQRAVRPHSHRHRHRLPNLPGRRLPWRRAGPGRLRLGNGRGRRRPGGDALLARRRAGRCRRHTRGLRPLRVATGPLDRHHPTGAAIRPPARRLALPALGETCLPAGLFLAIVGPRIRTQLGGKLAASRRQAVAVRGGAGRCTVRGRPRAALAAGMLTVARKGRTRRVQASHRQNRTYHPCHGYFPPFHLDPPQMPNNANPFADIPGFCG